MVVEENCIPIVLDPRCTLSARRSENVVELDDAAARRLGLAARWHGAHLRDSRQRSGASRHSSLVRSQLDS